MVQDWVPFLDGADLGEQMLGINNKPKGDSHSHRILVELFSE
ncbi:hypothetical protein SVI_0471 [Shewanella violacea DSS12]|uniref:Uncharacterized protein n=1 Tax=Shewanella violacea (strain JCM 10179 / CIP 106290 / LMG 19151 / DSS12) TaxID=637905 RepID=D4ZFJ3_SHEVD|nr:hypothetical protein SVI_0471 [Shewanella violacea DSS12]